MGSHLKADVRQKLENMCASLLCPDCASNIGEVLVFASCARGRRELQSKLVLILTSLGTLDDNMKMSDELFFDIISSSWSGHYVQKLLSPLRSYMYALFFAPGDKSDSQTFIAFAFVNCWPVWLIGDDAKRTTSPQNIYYYERYVPN